MNIIYSFAIAYNQETKYEQESRKFLDLLSAYTPSSQNCLVDAIIELFDSLPALQTYLWIAGWYSR